MRDWNLITLPCAVVGDGEGSLGSHNVESSIEHHLAHVASMSTLQ